MAGISRPDRSHEWNDNPLFQCGGKAPFSEKILQRGPGLTAQGDLTQRPLKASELSEHAQVPGVQQIAPPGEQPVDVGSVTPTEAQFVAHPARDLAERDSETGGGGGHPDRGCSSEHFDHDTPSTAGDFTLKIYPAIGLRRLEGCPA